MELNSELVQPGQSSTPHMFGDSSSLKHMPNTALQLYISMPTVLISDCLESSKGEPPSDPHC